MCEWAVGPSGQAIKTGITKGGVFNGMWQGRHQETGTVRGARSALSRNLWILSRSELDESEICYFCRDFSVVCLVFFNRVLYKFISCWDTEEECVLP